MGQIRILPPDVVNRIAAGEVIERPASVVKELAENSIDAGATEVVIEVEDGGRKRIRIRDNGSGMAPEDLSLAFRSHATSKIPLPPAPSAPGASGEGGASQGLDLFGLVTLGFRGEALASIAAVAEVEAVSRTAGSDCAYRYRVRGAAAAGEEVPGEGPDPVAGPLGTAIEVRNLFFNTPARRKFLRSGSTELSHIAEQAARLALGFPGIRFVLESGGKRILDCPATSSLRERLAAVIGREKARELLEVREPAGGPPGIQVRGFVGPPRLHRADTRGQQFFVDGRWVRDRVLGHALQEAYRGFQIPGQKPVAYLFVDVPRGSVDVNVHPTKCEVRFLDSNAVHRATYAAVREALEKVEKPPEKPPREETPDLGADDVRRRVLEAAQDFFAAPRGGAPRGGPSRPAPAGAPRPERGPAAGPARPAAVPPAPAEPSGMPSARSLALELPAESPAGRGRPIQVLESFILVESEGGLVFYDQHALHEKILYERLLADLRSPRMPRQRLLIPEVVELPLELAPLQEELSERLGKVGFEAEPFGPRELAVQAVPAVLGDAAAGPIVLEVGRWLLDGGPAREGADSSAGADPLDAEVRRLAQIVACKRAVKAGMPLTDGEIRDLLGGAALARDPRFCPHGRPTSVEIPRSELERRFSRK